MTGTRSCERERIVEDKDSKTHLSSLVKDWKRSRWSFNLPKKIRECFVRGDHSKDSAQIVRRWLLTGRNHFILISVLQRSQVRPLKNNWPHMLWTLIYSRTIWGNESFQPWGTMTIFLKMSNLAASQTTKKNAFIVDLLEKGYITPKYLISVGRPWAISTSMRIATTRLSAPY